MIKKSLLLTCFLYMSFSAFSQNLKKLYFLADTINTPKFNQVVRIETVGIFEYSFIFNCKCAPPYKSYVSFHYLKNIKKPKGEVSSKKPNYPYVTFKEFMDKVAEHHRYLKDEYDIYITEVLPGKKYRTNKVIFNIYREPVN